MHRLEAATWPARCLIRWARMSRGAAADAEASDGVTVEGVMRPAVTTLEREAHLAAAAYLMQRGGRSALVVVTPGDRPRPLSVITNTDIARAIADGMDVNALRISEVADRPVVLTHPDLAVAEAARVMLDAYVRQLPVARDGTLVGVLEMADACRALLGQRSNQPTAVRTQPSLTPAANA